MSKIKMRCISCGKWFQSANAKEVTCLECVQKSKKEKLAAKTAPPAPQKFGGPGPNAPRAAAPSPPKTKPGGGGTSHWLDRLNDVKVAEPEQQPARPKLPNPPGPEIRDNRGGPDRAGQRGPGTPGSYRDAPRGPGNYREEGYRGPGAYRTSGQTLSGTLGQRPRQPMEGGRGPRPTGPAGPGKPNEKKNYRPKAQKPPRPPAPPRPKREKIPPPTPFVATPEQVAQVEARYKELATPAEFDGIRSQIAKELTIPKSAIKKIIKELRERESIPSWWEVQTYKGDSEELAKIKAAYEPYLPVPPVGVHKIIGETLTIKPGVVYQAIKSIRLELNLPQYNDPTVHGMDLTAPPKPVDNTQEQNQEQAHPETDTLAVPSATDAPATSDTEATAISADETATKPEAVDETSAVADNTSTEEK